MYNEQSREVEGFIQSIIEDPLNDDTRLIFADWLEENSGEDRAAFIRAQLILDKQRDTLHPAGYHCPHTGTGYTCKTCFDLAETERKLFHYGDVRGGCGLDAKDLTGYNMINSPLREFSIVKNEVDRRPIWRFSWCRGFVDQISCSWSNFCKQYQTLKKRIPFTKVLLLTMPRLYEKTAVDLTAPRGWSCGCSITDREWSWHTLGKPHIINPEPNTIIKLILKHEFEGIWFSFVEGIKSDDEVYAPRLE